MTIKILRYFGTVRTYIKKVCSNLDNYSSLELCLHRSIQRRQRRYNANQRKRGQTLTNLKVIGTGHVNRKAMIENKRRSNESEGPPAATDNGGNKKSSNRLKCTLVLMDLIAEEINVIGQTVFSLVNDNH